MKITASLIALSLGLAPTVLSAEEQAAKISQPNSCDAQRRLLAMVPPIRALFVQARPHLFTQLYWSMIG